MTDKITKLMWSIQALAQPAEVQLGLFPDFVCKADELALDFDDALKSHTDNFSPEQARLLKELDKKLESFSGESNSRHWTEEALRGDAVWDEVRLLAKRTLQVFKWLDESPPKEPEARGSSYVKGKG